MRWTTLALALAVAGAQGALWLGRDNMPQVMSLEAQLAAQQRTNEAARERNQRTVAEVSDLKEGLEMVEEKARAELGMVKPDEILVQYTGTAAAGMASGTGSDAAAGPAPVPPGP